MQKGNSKKIHLNLPVLTGNELAHIEQALNSGFITSNGPCVDEFEQLIAQRVERPYALATNSGTSALHLILKTLNLQLGEYVICSDLTFIGGVAPIRYEGAIPYFIDSDMQSWNMSPSLLEEAILDLKAQSKKIKAIILTHIYGLPSKEEEVYKIADKHNIPVIEDCAEAFGTTYKNNPVGKKSYASFYSFNGNKMITTTSGGMISTSNKEVHDRCKYFSNQAKTPVDYYLHEEIGYNYRLSNILAAIGIAQFKFLDHKIEQKKNIAHKYRELLSIEGITFSPINDFGVSNNWLNCLTIDKDILEVSNKEIMTQLNQHNIEAGHLWNPMSLQPVFKEMPRLLNGTSKKLFSEGLCLPSACSLTEEDISHICQNIKNIIDKR